jgi:ribosomal protein S8
MLISTAIKSELSPANFKHYNIELLDGESTFGNDTTDVRTLPHFTKIKASGAVKVIFVQDSVQNVRVVAPTKMLDRIYTTVEGEKLIISTRKLRNYASKVEIYLANDSIYQYQGRGATRFIADKYISTSHFNLDLSGASKAQVDSLFTTDFTSEISGASNAEIAGKTISSKIKLNGASHLKANGFISTTAIVDVNGASSANVNVEQSIDANASGASKIRYIGNPTVKSIKSSGSSSIKAINND